MAKSAAPERRRFMIGKRAAPYLFLLPFLIVFVAFLIIPLFNALGLSVYKTTLVGGTRFVGFDNFAKAFVDPKFWTGVLTLLKFGAMQIPVMLILALVFALILDSGTVYLRNFFRVGFFIPYAVPTVIAALMRGFLYGPAYGPFTQLADAMGWPRPYFFGPNTILPSLAEHRGLGVYGLQHDHLLRGAAGDAERARGGVADGRGERVPPRAPHQAAADRADDPRDHRLLDHRYAAALHRALPDDQPRQERDLEFVHAQPIRLYAGLHRAAVQLFGGDLLPARGGDGGALLHLHARDQPGVGARSASSARPGTARSSAATAGC